MRLLLTAALVVLAVALLAHWVRPLAEDGSVPVPAVPPVGAAPDPADPAGWAASRADAIEVPAAALRAYARAALRLAAEQPSCGLAWTTLAGIGAVESDHGRYAGARLADDGTSDPPIIGIPLNGSTGFAEIADTDGGRLDGDSTYDRAVGPMQFIPQTWSIWAADGDGDGRADPFDLDDAALAAGRYLCARGRDLSTPEGWAAGLYSYNRSTEYADRVRSTAATYAARSQD